jgi:hypothetical protein
LLAPPLDVLAVVLTSGFLLRLIVCLPFLVIIVIPNAFVRLHDETVNTGQTPKTTAVSRGSSKGSG